MSESKKKAAVKEEVNKRRLSVETLIGHLANQLVSNKKFRVCNLNDVFVPIQIIGDECEIFKPDIAMKFIRDESEKIAAHHGEMYSNPDAFFMTNKTAKTVYGSLLLVDKLHVKGEVKTFAFKSDPALAFCRIPFDPVVVEEVPENWAKLLSNFTNTEAVMMWIGSLFFPKSDRSQYLWLYGKGGNGKSTMAKIISSVLGSFVRYEQVPAKDDKYWTFGLLGKRLIVMDDCNKYGFIKEGIFKSLTGSSKVRVEQKFGQSYDADLDCKFLFTSNEMPMVSNQLADQRRLIFSSALNQTKFEYDKDFEARLKEEIPLFISVCMEKFKAACSDGRPIPSNQEEALELGNCFNEEIECWVESMFNYEADSYVETSKFRHLLSQTKLNDKKVFEFLESKGVKRDQKRVSGGKKRIIVGLRQKVFPISLNGDF